MTREQIIEASARTAMQLLQDLRGPCPMSKALRNVQKAEAVLRAALEPQSHWEYGDASPNPKDKDEYP